MGKTRFTEEQIVDVLNEYETGKSVVEICQEYGISKTTFYNWRKNYESLKATGQDRIKEIVLRKRDIDRKQAAVKSYLMKDSLSPKKDTFLRTVVFVPAMIIVSILMSLATIQIIDLGSKVVGFMVNTVISSTTLSYIFGRTDYILCVAIVFVLISILIVLMTGYLYGIIGKGLRSFSPSEKLYSLTIKSMNIVNALNSLYAIWSFCYRRNISWTIHIVIWSIVSTVIVLFYNFFIIKSSWLNNDDDDKRLQL